MKRLPEIKRNPFPWLVFRSRIGLMVFSHPLLRRCLRLGVVECFVTSLELNSAWYGTIQTEVCDASRYLGLPEISRTARFCVVILGSFVPVINSWTSTHGATKSVDQVRLTESWLRRQNQLLNSSQCNEVIKWII